MPVERSPERPPPPGAAAAAAGAASAATAPGAGGGDGPPATDKPPLDPSGGAVPKSSPSSSGAAPPPSPQFLQLTPDLFQQAVAAAVAAVASMQPVPAPVAAPAASVGPATREKKLADFWTSRPTMWFRLFDGPFPSTLSEDRRFNALLNHLPSESLPFVDHILRAPGLDPFTRAKDCLIRHYEVSPRDLARKLRSLNSLGDRKPTEMLFYMRSLLPGYQDNPLFEVIFIDLLPANARDAAVKFSSLEDMATAADEVLAEEPVPSSSMMAPLPEISHIACDSPRQSLAGCVDVGACLLYTSDAADE